jgi:hypothetical protein
MEILKKQIIYAVVLAVATSSSLQAVTETRLQTRKNAERPSSERKRTESEIAGVCNMAKHYADGDAITREVKRHSPEMPVIENLVLVDQSHAAQQPVQHERPDFAKILKSDNGLEGIILEEADLENLPEGYARWLMHDLLQRGDTTNADNIRLLSKKCTLEEVQDLIVEASMGDNLASIKLLITCAHSLENKKLSESSYQALAKSSYSAQFLQEFEKKAVNSVAAFFSVAKNNVENFAKALEYYKKH